MKFFVDALGYLEYSGKFPKDPSKALDAAIVKWKAIYDYHVNFEGDRPVRECGAASCPLCHVYLKDLKCTGCPVYDVTKQHGCDGTVFELYVNARSNWDLENLSLAMLNFLRALKK